MKKKLVSVSVVLILLGVSHFGHADIYSGADIILNGDQYSDIIYGEVNNPDNPGGWYTADNNGIRNGFGNQWVEYEAELSEGNWNVGLNVINSGNLGSDGWYTHFEIHNSLTNEITAIPASDTEINYGFVNVAVNSAGIHTVRYIWQNDAYENPFDANIIIDSVFFDNTATPPLFESDPQVGENTADYVPKWDGNALVSGMIFDNDTRIGVGTSEPAATLDVNGDVAVSGIPVINSSGQWIGEPSGLIGPQGPKGDQGDPGLAGPKGDKGDQGDGISCNSCIDDELSGSSSQQTSGAYKIGIYDEFYYSNSTNIQDVLNDMDTAIKENCESGGSGEDWLQSGSDIYYNQGNVGIGTATPETTLDVSGNIKANNIEANNIGSVLTIWGNPECPAKSESLYSGFGFGGYYAQIGGGVEPACITSENIDTGATGPGSSYGDLLYPLRTGGSAQMPPNIIENRVVKCAKCYVESPFFEIWGTSTCPEGWTAAYTGYGMGGFYNHAHPSNRKCVDNVNFDYSVLTSNVNAEVWYGTVMHNNNDINIYETDRYVKCAVCIRE